MEMRIRRLDFTQTPFLLCGRYLKNLAFTMSLWTEKGQFLEKKTVPLDSAGLNAISLQQETGIGQ
jgi:hypothetical protein